MTTQLDTIVFRGDDLLVTVIDGKAYIVLKRAFENIGLDADRQIAKLQKQPWACTAVTAVQVGDQVRNMVVADVRTFLMALATIPASRVSAHVRGTLIAYQSEVADVIEAYYTKGAAFNHRVTEEQLPAVVNNALNDYRTEREKQIAETGALRLMQAQVTAAKLQLIGSAVSLDLIDAEWGKIKAQVLVSRELGEAPAIDQDQVPVYVEEFMKSKRVPKSKITRFSGAFGRKIKTQALIDGVPVPGKRTQELPDGTLREVTAWTRKHLGTFERAWSTSYAHDPRLVAE